MVEQKRENHLPSTDNHRETTDLENSISLPLKTCCKTRNKCCICITSTFLILATIIIILVFTIFRVKDPIIKVNGVTTNNGNVSSTSILKPGTNLSLLADISVKNPNYASFKYTNTTTNLYYYGALLGSAVGPPGHARAQRTMRMNISVNIMMSMFLNNSNFLREFRAGFVSMTSFSRVPGRAKILNVVKMHVTVKMNCSFVVNITSFQFLGQKCKRKVEF